MKEFEQARKHDYRKFTVLLKHGEMLVRECPYCWGLIATDRYIDHVHDCKYFPQPR